MNAAKLVNDLRARGYSLELRGTKLRVEPATLTPDLVAAIKENKVELLTLLAVPDHYDPLPLDPASTVEIVPTWSCPKCGRLAGWFDGMGGEHCDRCEPAPGIAERLLEIAWRLRRRKRR